MSNAQSLHFYSWFIAKIETNNNLLANKHNQTRKHGPFNSKIMINFAGRVKQKHQESKDREENKLRQKR